MFNCEQQFYKQGQKWWVNNDYFQLRQKWLVRNPLVEFDNKNVERTHTVKQKRDLPDKHCSQDLAMMVQSKYIWHQ